MNTDRGRNWHWHTLLWLTVLIQLWPLLFMISTSFKTMDQIFQSTLNPIPTAPVLDNYRYVLESLPLLHYIWNTLFIASGVAIAKVVTSILAGFAFVYYEFPHKEKIFNALLLTFFIPITVVIMPNYLLVSKLGLINTPWGVMLPQLADGMGIFLMRQTMRTIPRPLLEAARLENASPWTILTRIIIPLIKPSVIAISIVFFINSWNEYFWPLLVLSDKPAYTLPLALQMFISAEGGSAWGVAMAVATLTSLPPLLLYLVCQRFIINTFMQSGVKG
jgi:sn-glycerol 3-phosphate transport system permease protein